MRRGARSQWLVPAHNYSVLRRRLLGSRWYHATQHARGVVPHPGQPYPARGIANDSRDMAFACTHHVVDNFCDTGLPRVRIARDNVDLTRAKLNVATSVIVTEEENSRDVPATHGITPKEWKTVGGCRTSPTHVPTRKASRRYVRRAGGQPCRRIHRSQRRWTTNLAFSSNSRRP